MSGSSKLIKPNEGVVGNCFTASQSEVQVTVGILSGGGRWNLVGQKYRRVGAADGVCLNVSGGKWGRQHSCGTEPLAHGISG